MSLKSLIDKPTKLLELIDKYLKPKDIEKKKYGEVFTPLKLVNEMLNKLPKKVWTNKNLKWFDPASGIGNFLIVIYLRLMEGLKNKIPNKNKRKKHILENMLYMSEINKKNCIIYKQIFDVNNKYKMNIHRGNSLKLNIKKKWNIDGFDIIVGNPPYQITVGKRNSKPIWNLFVIKFIDNLMIDGYLLFVHPSGWRSPCGVYRDVYDKIMSKNLIYINMNDYKKGKDIFDVGTNFDYYLLQNNKKKQLIKVIDINDREYNMNFNKWSFIPSGCFKLYEKVLALNGEKKVNILHDYSSYETRKKWMSKTKTNKYKYPCCYTITSKNNMRCLYSSKKKGHFGIPKIIWSNGLGTYPFIDKEGKYGLTQFSYAIVDTIKNLKNIEKAMNSKKFLKLMEYGKIDQDHKYNYKIIKLFKKDFWKYFL